LRANQNRAADLGKGRLLCANQNHVPALGKGSDRVSTLGNGALVQNPFLSPVENIVCLPDSSSGSGEGNGRSPKSLRSDSRESGPGMPKVCLLSAAGGESMGESDMGESDLSLGISITAAAGRWPSGRRKRICGERGLAIGAKSGELVCLGGYF
jgi:hypothetical protein